MIIKKVEYENFRNLQDGNIVPSPDINVIWGDNAQGKTNLLEGIWLFTGGHSFRGNKDSELPKLIEGKNAKNSTLYADFFSGERDQQATLKINNGKRSSIINGVEKKTGSALVGKICGVIFSPEHLLLVKEGPQKRRNFIDGAICQIKPSYVKLLVKYNRSLSQRNTLIKEISKHPELCDTMDVWNEHLISFGSKIILERIKYINKIAPRAKEIYKGISKDKETIGISYESFFTINEEMISMTSNLNATSTSLLLEEISQHYRAALKKALKSDLKIGFTSVGPHRDDIEITLNDLSARIYGSQGQQRSVVLALKLSEADILEKSIGESPIILLDDVMSELDNNRQDYLLNHLYNRQVFITCCSPETVNLMERGKTFYVKNGKIEG